MTNSEKGTDGHGYKEESGTEDTAPIPLKFFMLFFHIGTALKRPRSSAI